MARTRKAENILEEVSHELKLVEIGVDQAVSGVKELVQSPVPHPLRGNFFKDLVVMDTEKCFKKYFPITIRHRIEKQVRVYSARLGIYQTMKRIFWIVNKGKVIKR